MPHNVTPLIEAIRTATSFEEAGFVLLRQLLNFVTAELAASRFAGQGQVLRGLIHLRTEDAYRQVLVVSRLSAAADWMIERNPETMSSAKKWRWMTEHHAAVSFDLPLGKVQQHVDGKAIPLDKSPGSEAITTENPAALRAATHLFTAPLRAPGGILDGMLCIEVNCPAALGENFIWDGCSERLQMLCDVAAPYLLQLPAQTDPRLAPDRFLPVIGASMAKVVRILGVFARQEENLLIGGPTGAGKSRLARWCHEQSPRRRGHFEAIDLSNVPETLQMGELCGWKKGAFTDAQQDTPGAISRAEGGTLFIDEVDKLSLKAQAGLLHILEERKYRALGERGNEREANTRFLIGTNADLQQAVRAGRFREDLYYRINVLPVKVPPLCERRDEIVPWARFMLQRRHGKSAGAVSLATDAERLLSEQPWPGNLRQLDNIIRRAYALLLLEERRAGSGLTLTLQHVERALQWEVWPLRARSLPDLLTDAAESFVRVAQQRPLDLDLADAFRGFVLTAAIQQLGNREAAFRLLGKEQLVKSRNHQKVLKRELERTTTLFEAIGEPPSLSLDRAEKDNDVGAGEES